MHVSACVWCREARGLIESCRSSSKHTSDGQDSPKRNKVPWEVQGKQSAEFRGGGKINAQERRVHKTTRGKNKWQVFAKT